MEEINIWALRPRPNEENISDLFLEKNIIAVGWSRLPDLGSKNKEQIKKLIEEHYSSYDNNSRKLGLHTGILNNFVNQMKEDDIVIVPDEKKLHIAQIDNEYEYKDNESDIPHQQDVRWLITNINRSETPQKLQKGLQSMLALFSLNKNREEILEWVRQVVPREKLRNVADLPDKLKEAVVIEIALEHASQPPPAYSIFNLAKQSIPENTRKKAQEIAEKAKVWSGNGKWQGEWLVLGYEDHPLDLCSEEILQMFKNGLLEEKAQQQKKQIFNEGKKRLKTALREAKNGDRKPLVEAVTDIMAKDDLVDGISKKIFDEIRSEGNENTRKILLIAKLESDIEKSFGMDETYEIEKEFINNLQKSLMENE